VGQIKYYLNTGKGDKKARPIMISYHFSGQRLVYYSGIRIAENEFNVKSEKTPAKADCYDQIFINNRLKLIRNFIGEIENEALAGAETLTPDLFKNRLNCKLKAKSIRADKSKVTLMQYFDIFIEDTMT